MVEKEVTFVLKAVDEASPVLDALKAKMESVERSLNVALPAAVNGTKQSPSTSPNLSPAVKVKKPIEEINNTMQQFSDALRTSLDPKTFDFSAFSTKGFDKAVGGNIMKGMTPKTVPEKTTDKQKEETLISTDQANFMRALGQYRIAWLGKLKQEGGEGTTGGLVKGAAALVILQAIGDGIQKIVQILADASPILRAEMKVLRIAFGELLRPIGDVLAAVLRPLARAMMKSNVDIIRALSKAGLKPGTEDYMSAYYHLYLEEATSMLLDKDLMTQEELDKSVKDWQMNKIREDYQDEYNDDPYTWDSSTPEGWLKKWFGTDNPGTPENEAGIFPRMWGFADEGEWGWAQEERMKKWGLAMDESTTTIVDSLTNLATPLSTISTLFTNLAPPLQTMANILGVGGDKEGGSGGTLNLGGLTINNYVPDGLEDAIEDGADWVENKITSIIRGYK